MMAILHLPMIIHEFTKFGYAWLGLCSLTGTIVIFGDQLGYELQNKHFQERKSSIGMTL